PIFEINRRFTESVAEVLREGVRSGEMRGDVPIPLLRDMIFGCIEHQTWAVLRGEGDFSVDDVTEGIITVVYRGMRAPTGTAGQSPAEALGDTAQRLERVAARLERALQPRRAS